MNIEEHRDAVIAQPARPATASVIWLHGLGADGHDFVPLIDELGLPDDAAVRFVFPHAPLRPVTILGGERLRAWFDILGPDRRAAQDQAGIRASAARVHALIDAEQAGGVAPARIIVAGFSQGGALALFTVLRHPLRLGGLIALSTYLPMADTLAAEASEANRELPILMCHGDHDPVLSLQLGRWSRDCLRANGHAVEWHRYPIGHELCADEVRLLADWLRPRLSAP